jgi:uncharacterized protein
MRPSIALQFKRPEIREAVGRFRATNPRIFGSTAQGQDTEGSDLDILVDALPGTTLFHLGGLQMELEHLLGVSVDVVTPQDLPIGIRKKIVELARPI